MHSRTRMLIFYTFVLLFIVGGTYALTAAFGFALDIAGFRIIKTGSLSLDFTPREVELTLNGSPQELDRRFLGRDVLVKNLLPGAYEVKIEAPGRYPWERTMTVRAGEVVRASGIILWPVRPKPGEGGPTSTGATSGKPVSETVAENVAGFWITGGGVVTQNHSGELSRESVRLRGAEVTTSDPSSPLLVTRGGGNYFLINLENPKAVLNLTELFQSLKEQQLGLPGTAPLKWVLLHPFTSSKLILSTERALYALDVRKVALEKLAETTSTVAVVTNRNEAIVADRSGSLIVANLVLGSASRELGFAPRTFTRPELGEGGPVRISSNRNGSILFALTGEGMLLSYSRDGRATSTLGTAVADLALSPDENRLAILSEGGTLTVVLLKDSHEDNGMRAGDRFEISLPNRTTLSHLAWLPHSSRYLLGIDGGGTLAAYEADTGAPSRAFPIAEKVAGFTAHNGTLYVLHTDGVLEKIAPLP